MTKLLGRVQQTNVEERERVVRFLMDVGWLAEAKQELDRLVKDFPDPNLKERAASARLSSSCKPRRCSAAPISTLCKRAQQYDRATKLLKSFTDKVPPTQLLVEIRDLERRDQQQHAADLGAGGRAA